MTYSSAYDKARQASFANPSKAFFAVQLSIRRAPREEWIITQHPNLEQLIETQSGDWAWAMFVSGKMIYATWLG